MQILIVDDHPLFREGLANMLSAKNRILFANDAIEGVAILQRESAIALVLLDGNLPKMNGIRAIPLIRQLRPQLPIIMISANEKLDDVRAAMKVGTNGYLSKSAKSAEIIDAIRMVMGGARYIPAFASAIEPIVTCAAAGEHIGRDGFNALGLTAKQAEVLVSICEGLSNKAIAERMAITENTVKAHVSAVFSSLKVKSRTQALLVARANGFASDAP